jgi:putative ABC transport system permease protein
VDNNFFKVFDLELIEGNSKNALADIPSVVLTEEMARKHLGEGPYLGRTITINDFYERDHKVTGVLKNLPDNTHLDFDFLFPIDEKIYGPVTPQGNTLTRWNGLGLFVYFTLKEGETVDRLEAGIHDWMDKYFPDAIAQLVGIKGSELFTPNIVPVKDIHLYSEGQGDMKPHGSLTIIYSFGGIAFLILVIAAINFMNLATAQSTLRSKEVAVRKIMGAKRKQLFVQFEGESLFYSFLALIMGLGMLYLVLPYFNSYTQREIDFSTLLEPSLFLTTVGLALFVGLVAGLHPALVLSGVRPAKVLMSNKSSSPATSRLRAALVVFQFAISAVLMIATILIFIQTKYVQNMDMGYDRENVWAFRGLNRQQITDQKQTFEDRIKELPGVTNVALSSFAPGDGDGNGLSLVMPTEENRIVMFFRSVDENFFPFFNTSPLAGRLFDETRPTDILAAPEGGPTAENPWQRNVIMNLKGIKHLGFTTPEEAIGKFFYTGQGNTVINNIIGVIPDINFNSPRIELQGQIYYSNPLGQGTLLIRYNTDNSEDLGAEIDAVFKEMFPTQSFVRQYVEENIEAQFQGETIQGTLLAIFSALAILVACMGLFGLASFNVARRTKEIGLRKVMGASSPNIVALLLGQFSIPVIIANVIAWPFGYYAISEWIEGFSYRIDLAPYFVGVALLAVILTLGIAWATVAGHAFKVARTNPIRALRYEN